MFKAALISMGEGQSYDNVTIYEREDFATKDIPQPFENRTLAFECCNKLYIVHVWNIISILFDKVKRTGPGISADRIIISGDASYDDIIILDQESWVAQKIPYVLKTEDGITGQMVFSNSEGTFITLDSTVTSIAMRIPKTGLTTSTQITTPEPVSIVKQTAVNQSK